MPCTMNIFQQDVYPLFEVEKCTTLPLTLPERDLFFKFSFYQKYIIPNRNAMNNRTCIGSTRDSNHCGSRTVFFFGIHFPDGFNI